MKKYMLLNLLFMLFLVSCDMFLPVVDGEKPNTFKNVLDSVEYNDGMSKEEVIKVLVDEMKDKYNITSNILVARYLLSELNGKNGEEIKKIAKGYKELQEIRREAEERYRKEQGYWEIRYYVDEFGEKTNNGYIANIERIKGNFSNSATTNSKLGVKILISNFKNFDIKLYEYDRNHPVQVSAGKEDYEVLIKSSKGKHEFLAELWGDRLSFKEKDSEFLHSLLKENESIKFLIKEKKDWDTKYSFELKNGDDYLKEYNELISGRETSISTSDFEGRMIKITGVCHPPKKDSFLYRVHMEDCKNLKKEYKLKGKTKKIEYSYVNDLNELVKVNVLLRKPKSKYGCKEYLVCDKLKDKDMVLELKGK